MGLAQSNSYSGINYCGGVAEWRKRSNPDRLTLLFVFENAPSDFTHEMACRHLTNKYGDNIFDGMRIQSILEDFPESKKAAKRYVIIVEAHFLRKADRQKLLSDSLGSSTDKSEKVEYFGLSIFGTKDIKMKIMTLLPATPSFTAYTIDDLPLGSYWEKCDVVKKRVIDALFRNAQSSTTKDVIEAKHFVDIAAGKAEDKYFNGSVTVILKDITNLDPKKLEFNEYGKTFEVSKHGVHFQYCSTCRRLDSHSEDDCPFPKRKRPHY